jgi:hypothetical protein
LLVAVAGPIAGAASVLGGVAVFVPETLGGASAGAADGAALDVGVESVGWLADALVTEVSGEDVDEEGACAGRLSEPAHAAALSAHKKRMDRMSGLPFRNRVPAAVSKPQANPWHTIAPRKWRLGSAQDGPTEPTCVATRSTWATASGVGTSAACGIGMHEETRHP